MARFARQILSEFQVLVQKLEVTLGPDTSDLDLRVGMHSGPVTGKFSSQSRTFRHYLLAPLTKN